MGVSALVSLLGSLPQLWCALLLPLPRETKTERLRGLDGGTLSGMGQ